MNISKFHHRMSSCARKLSYLTATSLCPVTFAKVHYHGKIGAALGCGGGVMTVIGRA